MKLTPAAEREFQSFLGAWLTKNEGQPRPSTADFARAMWAGGVLSKLPQRELVALEVQHAELLARECGVPTPPRHY